MTKAILLKRCKDGDKEAFGTLYNTYSKRMMQIICHYVLDWNIAQDILHDGFLIIFSRIQQLRDADKLEYWMATIMKNLALQHLRNQDVMQMLNDDYETPEILDFEESITLEELHTMIERLPVGYRKVFKLAILEHKSHKEIAQLLGISEQTSGSQLFHARVLLRKMIIEHRIKMSLTAIFLASTLGISWLLRTPHSPQPATQLTSTQTSHLSQAWHRPEGARLPVACRGERSELPPVPNQHERSQHAQTTPLPTSAPPTVCLPDSGPDSSPDSSPTSLLADLPSDPQPDSPENPQAVLPSGLSAGLQPSSHQHGAEALQAEESSAGLRPEESSAGLRPGLRPRASLGATSTIPQVQSQLPRHYDYMSASSPLYTNAGLLCSPMPTAETTYNYEHELPVELGIDLLFPLNSGFSLESGLHYSILRSTQTESSLRNNQVVGQTIRKYKSLYLGVPLSLRHNLFSASTFTAYASFGLLCQIPLKGEMKISHINFDGPVTSYSPGIEWATIGSVGIEYRITDHIGLYAQPSARFFLYSSSPHHGPRSGNAIDFALPLGLRLNF